MDRVLVTGGTGFVGSHLVSRLLDDGHAVRVIARSAARARKRLPAATEIVPGDITDPQAVARAMQGQEIVYHLAAAFREPGISNKRYRDVHVGGTRLLLEAARAEGVRRFVHCSTVGVHAHIDNPPADETWPHRPGDIYQATKSEGERLALAFQREHNFPLTVVRPTPVYGPGDLRLLKLFRMIAHEHFVMLGKGEVFFHMVHVRDLVDGLRLAAECDRAIGEPFIVGGEEYCTLNELAERIASIWGVRGPKLHLPIWPFYMAGTVCEKVCVPLHINPPIYRRRVAFFINSRAFRTDKAKEMLGYQPQMDLQSGLEETAAWYQNNGYM